MYIVIRTVATRVVENSYTLHVDTEILSIYRAIFALPCNSAKGGPIRILGAVLHA